jgi:hypothetical protein
VITKQSRASVSITFRNDSELLGKPWIRSSAGFCRSPARTAGHRAGARTNLRFLTGTTGGCRPRGAPRPIRPVGCMRGLGRTPCRAPSVLAPRAQDLAYIVIRGGMREVRSRKNDSGSRGVTMTTRHHPRSNCSRTPRLSSRP